MRIGIDVSQIAYSQTGVSGYLSNLLLAMLEQNEQNEYILFFSSLRRELPQEFIQSISRNDNVQIRKFKLPPKALNILWNRLHIAPVEWFIGNVDVFITSDWTEPPAKKAKKATIIYDLTVFKTPDEMSTKIVHVQKRKLSWVKKESDVVFCISESTKEDVQKLLNIDPKKLKVIYPGI